jgi:hypothetical protein
LACLIPLRVRSRVLITTRVLLAGLLTGLVRSRLAFGRLAVGAILIIALVRAALAA